ncbi:MAG: hypothetical protein ACE5KO_03855, partial [Candidatus Bathyarchaeia archaeon]
MLTAWPPGPVHAQGIQFAVTNVYWGPSTESTLEPKPGDKNLLLSVELVNISEATVDNAIATLSLPNSPFRDPFGGQEATAGITSSMIPGETATVTFTVSILPEAELRFLPIPPATSIVDMNLKAFTARFSNGFDVLLKVKVPVLGKVELTLQPPQKVFSPGLNDFTVHLSNTGDAVARDVEATVEIPFKIDKPSLARIDADDRIFFSKLAPNTIVTTNLKIFIPTTAADTAYLLTFTLSYKDAYGYSQTTTRTVGMAIGSGTVSAGVNTGQYNNVGPEFRT